MSHQNGGKNMRALLRARLAVRPVRPEPAIRVQNGRRVEALSGRALGNPEGRLNRLRQEAYIQFRDDFYRCLMAKGLDMEEIMHRINSTEIVSQNIPEHILKVLDDVDDDGEYTKNAMATIWGDIRSEKGNADQANVMQARGREYVPRRRRFGARAIGNADSPIAAMFSKLREAADRVNVTILAEDLTNIMEFLTNSIVEAECFDFQLSNNLFDSLVFWWNLRT